MRRGFQNLIGRVSQSERGGGTGNGKRRDPVS